MNQALSGAMGPEFFARIYDLLAMQVKRYHRHYRMGDNTSVPEETAKALMDSIWYTLSKTDLSGQDPAAALAQGQAVLKEQAEEARRRLALVRATMPEEVSESYHRTVEHLERWLPRYDPEHFAHRAPDFLEYPLLDNRWQELSGIDRVLYYLKCLWQENQILAAPVQRLPLYEKYGPDFWDAPMNLCEGPLQNAIGLALLGKPALDPGLTEADREAILQELKASQDPEGDLTKALKTVLREWEIVSPEAFGYAKSVIPQILARLTSGFGLDGLFL